MFRYCLVHASEHPLLAQGQAWPDLLSPREESILSGLGLLPRRRKWLLGRVAAKNLVREMSAGTLADHRISVLNQPSGEPFALIEGQGAWGRPISISHRSHVGMAAAPVDASVRIGADLETVEPRDSALVRQFFTDGEAIAVGAAGDARDEVVARIWSAKEAVLKLLGLGLRIDTRGVVVDLCPAPGSETSPSDWSSVDVKVVADLPRQSMLEGLRVVWRREAGYVLTVALSGGSRIERP